MVRTLTTLIVITSVIYHGHPSGVSPHAAQQFFPMYIPAPRRAALGTNAAPKSNT
jgi:hypothetical protein